MPQDNIENLQPFQKGVSGNPAGRPKTVPELDTILANVLGAEDENGISTAELIAIAMAEEAKKGNVRAAELLWNRAYGKQTIGVEITKRDVPIEEMTDEELHLILHSELARVRAELAENEEESEENRYNCPAIP